LATIVETVLLLMIIRGRLGGFDNSTLVRSAAKTGLAATVMGVAILWFTTWTATSSTLLQVGGAVIMGGFLFLAVSVTTGSEELRALRSVVKRKSAPSPRQ
jgi:hypothetical protein